MKVQKKNVNKEVQAKIAAIEISKLQLWEEAWNRRITLLECIECILALDLELTRLLEFSTTKLVPEEII